MKNVLLIGLVVHAFLLVGCEADGKKPMDEPLTADDAYDAEVRMRSDADGLLRERAPNEPLPPDLSR